MDKKLTDSEIVKAKIKAIYPHIKVSVVDDKPYYCICWYGIENKEMNIGFGSFNLEFVCEWLQENFEVVENDFADLINRLQAENERLKKGWKADVIETANIKAEAYKEFAERLKDYLRQQPKWCCRREKYQNVGFSYDEVFFGIDNLLKELVGEDNA